VPEITGAPAGGKHQIVVAQLSVAQSDGAIGQVNACDFIEQNIDVFLLVKNRANRRGDVGGRKSRHRHLIEQGLKKVMIGAVNQGDSNRCAFERTRCRKPPETSANNYDVGRFILFCH
jgi:hypothetical protein